MVHLFPNLLLRGDRRDGGNKLVQKVVVMVVVGYWNEREQLFDHLETGIV
jgi:hypothetical protein